MQKSVFSFVDWKELSWWRHLLMAPPCGDYLDQLGEDKIQGRSRNMLQGPNIASGVGTPRDPPPQELSHGQEGRMLLLCEAREQGDCKNRYKKVVLFYCHDCFRYFEGKWKLNQLSLQRKQ